MRSTVFGRMTHVNHLLIHGRPLLRQAISGGIGGTGRLPPYIRRHSAAHLERPFPRITSRAAAQRAQRHVADSLATLRHQLSVNLLARLTRCPCCARSAVKRSW